MTDREVLKEMSGWGSWIEYNWDEVDPAYEAKVYTMFVKLWMNPKNGHLFAEVAGRRYASVMSG